jgi:hypothetical protein
LVADKAAMAAVRKEVDQVAADTNTPTDSASGLTGARTFSQEALDKMTIVSSVVYGAQFGNRTMGVLEDAIGSQPSYWLKPNRCVI